MTTAQRAVLTDRYLKNLKPAPTGKRIVCWDAAKPSFGCRITDRGVVSFFVIRRMPGKPQPVRVVLGPLSRDQAWLKARKARNWQPLGDLVSGVHPKARVRKGANTFAALAEQFLRRPAAAKQRTAIGDPKRTINQHLIPRWGMRVASEINSAVTSLPCLRPSMRGSGPYMAAKALALASSVYRFGVTRELVESSPCHLINTKRLRWGEWPRDSGS